MNTPTNQSEQEEELKKGLRRKFQFFHHNCPADAVVDGDADLEKCTCGIENAITDALQLIQSHNEAIRKDERAKARAFYAKRNPQYTQQWVADVLGISRPTLAKWLKDPELITVGALRKLTTLTTHPNEHGEE